jgi:aerobic-type carbon monoxide dehydrogenase small subunit (CoxS/CutS family)
MFGIPSMAKGEGKGMKTIEFNLNSKQMTVEVDPTLRLIDFLRDNLGLTGTKEGCGEGECGACTVIIDGVTANSCLVMTGQINGCNITTIEGVAKGDKLHPIQQSFLQSGAVQCGYCIPGMVLSAKALLDENPQPSKDDIKKSISGNLCRCTGYKKIEEAILIASDKMQKGGE